MLVNFSVENYASIHDELLLNLTAAKRTNRDGVIHVDTYSMNVLPICGIYGANGSGKSNLVHALRFMQDKIIDKTERYAIPFKFESEANERKPSRFSVVFLDDENTMYQYGFSVLGNEINEEWLSTYLSARETMLFERYLSDDGYEYRFGNSLSKATKNGKKYLGFIAQGLEPQKLFLSEAAEKGVEKCFHVVSWFRKKLIVIGPNTRSMDIGPNLFASEQSRKCVSDILKSMNFDFYELIIQERKIDLDSILMLCRTADDHADIKDCFDNATAEQLFFQDTNRYVAYQKCPDGTFTEKRISFSHKRTDGSTAYLSIEATSSGFKRMLDLVLLLVADYSKNTTIVIDEIEQSLHTLLSMHFMRLFLKMSLENNHNGQLIFITHDTNLLNTDILRRDEIQFMEKDEFAASHITNLAEFKIVPGLNREKGYLEGRFGAIPILKYKLDEEGLC